MKNKELEERRTFIKKAVYSVPVIVGLGSMVVPVDAKASKHDSGVREQGSDTGTVTIIKRSSPWEESD